MREVIPDTLWIGNALEARDVKRVLDLQLQAVIDLAMEEPPIQFTREVVYCRFPLIDGPDNSTAVLKVAIDTTAKFLATKIPTLVACGAGMSRAPAIVAAAIALSERLSLTDALQKVTKDQPHDVSAGLLADIATLVQAPHGGSTHSAIRTRLAAVLRGLAMEKADTLAKLKANHRDLSRPDLVWHYLLQSFSTMGRAAGWHGLIGNHDNYAKVTFDALSVLNAKKRLARLDKTLRAAKVRMPGQKAERLANCFDRINELGGLSESRRQLLEAPGREGKLQFLMQFKGIGPKYARNIMMDVYHPEFRDSIAIDVRISGVSKSLGLDFPSYETHEAFYLSVAEVAGLNGWEVDRLMFNFRDEVVRRCHGEAVASAEKTDSR